MNSPLDTLYQYALESYDPGRWIMERDFLRDYRSITRTGEKQWDTLMDTLDAASGALLRKYMDNYMERCDMDQRCLFLEGIAMGIQLGMLTHLV